MDECVCHYSSIKKNEPLVTLSNIVAWNTLLNANRIRQHNKILNLVGSREWLSSFSKPQIMLGNVYLKKKFGSIDTRPS